VWQVDFMTQFTTVHDLLSEDDQLAMQELLDDGCSASDDGAGRYELFLVCHMKAACSLRRVSSVAVRDYVLKVGARITWG